MQQRLWNCAAYGTFIIASVLLAACSGTGINPDCELSIVKKDFSLCLPEGWEEVTEEYLAEKEVPEETIAAFRLSEQRGSQRDNIVVSHETLPGKASNTEYGNANMKTIETTPRYELLDKREITIDGRDALIHVFASKPIPDIPVRRFYQLSITEGSTGFTFTGTLPYSVSQEIEKEMLAILESISLQEMEQSSSS